MNNNLDYNTVCVVDLNDYRCEEIFSDHTESVVVHYRFLFVKPHTSH